MSEETPTVEAAARSLRPQRIQLRRTKGWRKPAGAIVVARPSKWGNPHAVGESFTWVTFGKVITSTIADHAEAVTYYRLWLDGIHPDSIDAGPLRDEICAELAGHDLACWCPLDQPCHADVLLEIANGGAA